jgi:hypothetical protein
MADHVKELPVVACRRGMAGLSTAAVAYRRGIAGLAMAAVAYRRVAIEALRPAAAAPLGLPLATEVKTMQ